MEVESSKLITTGDKRESVGQYPRITRLEIDSMPPRKKAVPAKNSVVETTLRVVLEPNEDAPVYYINFAEVTHTSNDFCVAGVRVPTKYRSQQIEEIQKSNLVRLPTDVQIVFPPGMLTGLIRALNTVKDNYEKNIGPLPSSEVKDND